MQAKSRRSEKNNLQPLQLLSDPGKTFSFFHMTFMYFSKSLLAKEEIFTKTEHFLCLQNISSC